MRIAVIYSSFSGLDTNTNPKYYGIQQFGFCHGLGKAGNEVTLFTSVPRYMAKEELSFLNFPNFSIKFYNGYLNKFGQVVLLNFEKDLSLFNPDLIIVGEDRQITSVLATFWAKKNNVPVILHQGLYHLGINKKILHKIFLITLGKYIHKNIKYAIAKTKAAKKYLISKGFKDENIFISPVGLDQNFIDASKEINNVNTTQQISDKPYLLCVARLVREKNLFSYLKISHNLSKMTNDLNFLLLGDGPLYNDIKLYIDSNDFNGRFILIREKLNRKQIAELMKDAKLTIITSSHEIFNMSMIESLFLGVPIIATNLGGMADVITNGYNGYLINYPIDETKAAELIYELLKNDDLYNKMRENAFESAKKYNWEKIGSELSEFLKSINF